VNRQKKLERLKMRQFLISLLLSAIIPVQAFSYPTIGARVRTFSGDPDQKIVTFSIRNNLEDHVDGYFYVIRMYDRHGLEILSAGQINQGYRNVNLPSGEVTRERIIVICRGIPERIEVEVMLIVPDENGNRIIQ